MRGGETRVARWSGILLLVAIPIVVVLLCFDIFNSISLYFAIESLPKPPAPLHLRDVGELVSFCATSLMPAIAILAGWAAFRQFQAAEKTRLVSVYMSISEKWDSDGIADARRRVYQLESFWEARRADLTRYATAADYIHAVLADARSNSPCYRDYILLMSYLEDIGLLCQTDYLNISDVSNIIGHGISEIMRLLIRHVEFERAEITDAVVRAAHYANALRLYEDLRDLTPTTIAGYGA